jgi:hypothetical protein
LELREAARKVIHRRLGHMRDGMLELRRLVNPEGFEPPTCTQRFAIDAGDPSYPSV